MIMVFQIFKLLIEANQVISIHTLLFIILVLVPICQILAEDKKGGFLIKLIYNNETLGASIVDTKFRSYYDIIQTVYDEYIATTFVCCVSLSGKSMEIFETNSERLKYKFCFG